MGNETLGTGRVSSEKEASGRYFDGLGRAEAGRKTEAGADSSSLLANLFAPNRLKDNSLKVSISENEMAALGDEEIMSLYEMAGRMQCLKAKVRRTCPDEASTSFLSK